MAVEFSSETVARVGGVLNDTRRPLAERFRALFTLRGIGGPDAIVQIATCFKDSSALLKHECAYCLGQMTDARAIPVLRTVLQDRCQDAMVRHEAAEALGAIGEASQLEILEEYSRDPSLVVADTCRIALARITRLSQDNEREDGNPYMSVDPAPPTSEGNIDEWSRQLRDRSLSLYQRYQALFALRNSGEEKGVTAIAAALSDTNPLFKHELAYVLGQMQHAASVTGLIERLADHHEHPMVRHECAEALGAIASKQCLAVLQQYTKDQDDVVRESCVVALDMYKYEHTNDFQYANTAAAAATIS